MHKEIKKQKVRVAVIGAGQWGTRIIKTLETLPDCEVVYVEARNYENLINKSDIDAVLVATPGSTHYRVALPFVKKGLPVFIEKPMTTSFKDAQILKQAAKKSGSLIFVGHIHLYNPAFLKAKELTKHIGRIRFIVSEGSNNGPYRNDMSALWDWAPHDISMILDVVGTTPVSVEGWGLSSLRPETALDDVAFVKINFSDGVAGFVFNSWLFSEKRKRLTIIGEKSSIVFDDTATKKVIFYENMGPDVEGKSIIRKEPSVSYPPYDPTLSLIPELEAFLEMVRTNTKPKTDIDNGLLVVKIIEAAEKSIRMKKRSTCVVIKR